jgi:hypothetical protein
MNALLLDTFAAAEYNSTMRLIELWSVVIIDATAKLRSETAEKFLMLL